VTHPARLLWEAGDAARQHARRGALRLALAETKGDLKAAAALLEIGYSTANALLAGSPDLRAWLDTNYEARKGARRAPDGARRVSPRR